MRKNTLQVTLINLMGQGKRVKRKTKRVSKNGNVITVGKRGHIKKYCYDFTRKLKQGRNTNTNANNSNCLVEVLTVSDLSVDNEWTMDSDCSFHMCPNIDRF